MLPEAARGRGASTNPSGRFERLRLDVVPADDPEDSTGESPPVRTEYFDDTTRTIHEKKGWRMMRPVRPVGLLAVMACLSATSCAVNPATGQRQLVLMSEGQEVALGREADQSVQGEMGVYPDETWQGYMQELGSSLAARTERPDLPWTFRVVDDPIVNAFALPGGFIYMTRGILAHFNSEAELASVLGHEIGHVTGRHGVEQASQAQLASIGLGVAAVSSERFARVAGLAQTGLGLMFLRFSRDHEREADDLGLRYMTRGNYDPTEMPKVFLTLQRVSAAQGAGRVPGWLSTHPDPGDRAERITQQVGSLPPDPARSVVNRDTYVQRLHGLVYGNNPRDGYTIDGTFYHPELRFELTFPSGWPVSNQRQAVAAVNEQQDAVVVLSLSAERTPADAARAFFAQEGLERGQTSRPGFTYFRTVPNPNQTSIVGLAGFFTHEGRVFQLLGYAAESAWSRHGRAMEESLSSFRTVTDRRYLDVQPAHVELVRLDRALTVEEFARRFPSSIDTQQVAILNGVDANGRFDAGQLVKRVVGGELPGR